MKITAALCWYDEPPQLLVDCVIGLAGVADRIVALDGAYRRFPGAKAESDPEQAAAIASAAATAGMECLILVPDRPWAGQVEKRATLLAAASVGSDWLAVVDADHIVHANAEAARYELAGYDASVDVVSVPFFTPKNPRRPLRASAATNWHAEMADKSVDIPHFFRALPGLTVEKFHWWYSAYKANERVWLWHNDGTGFHDGARVLAPRRIAARYEVEHVSLLRDEAHILANRAFCNDRIKVVALTGQEDDMPGLPAPTWDYDTVPY